MKKILFVCLGNICRSPAADGIFHKLISERDLADEIECDSCGTGNWHVGGLPDERMRRAGSRRGYNFSHRVRELCDRDYHEFNLIVAMDTENFQDIIDRAPKGFDTGKVHLFTEFCTGEFATFHGVPDPYYDGERGFELVLDIIENGCNNLIDFVA